MTLAPSPSQLNARFRVPMPPVNPPSKSGGNVIARALRFIGRLLLAAGGGLLVLVVWIALLGAASVNGTAGQIAAVIIVAAPLVLPLLQKYVNLNGERMVLFTAAVSVVVVGIAAGVDGLFSPTNFSSYPAILAVGTTLYGASQFVFQLLNQSGKFTVYVK